MILNNFLLLLLACSSFVVNENEWKKSLDKDQIIIYTRKVDNSPFHEFLAETEMTGSIEKFKKIITDFDEYPEWLPDCKSAEVIENSSDNEFIYHMKLSVPFPFENRDIVQQIILTESDMKLVVKITSLPDKIEREKKHVRMIKADGYWEITQVADDKISIKFQYLADPGGGVPAWMVNSFIVKNPHKTLQNLRKMMLE